MNLKQAIKLRDECDGLEDCFKCPLGKVMVAAEWEVDELTVCMVLDKVSVELGKVESRTGVR